MAQRVLRRRPGLVWRGTCLSGSEGRQSITSKSTGNRFACWLEVQEPVWLAGNRELREVAFVDCAVLVLR
jgi:hypothetical protein